MNIRRIWKKKMNIRRKVCFKITRMKVKMVNFNRAK